MAWYWWALIAFTLFNVVLFWSCCVVAKRADEQWDRICEDMDEKARARGVQASARIVECGTNYRTEARGGIPPFFCIEDAEHTALAVAAIRARKRRESLAEIVTKQ